MANPNVMTKLTQSPHTADTKYHLLFYSVLGLTSVKLEGNFPVLEAIFGSIGIEKIQRYSSDLRAPDPAVNDPTGKLNLGR
jgi:hypothetical protein